MSKLNIWRVLGLVLVFAIAVWTLNVLTDYCFDKSTSTLLNLAGLLGSILTVWLAWKVSKRLID